MDEKRLRTIDCFLTNALYKLQNRKSLKDEISALYFMRGVCRELQYLTKDKKLKLSFSKRAKIFQNLMTLRRKQFRRSHPTSNKNDKGSTLE